MKPEIVHSVCVFLLFGLARCSAKPQGQCQATCPVSCYPDCSPQCCLAPSDNTQVLSQPQQEANMNDVAISHHPLSLSEVDKISEKTAVACEEDKILLKCKNKFDKMTILSTFYGRDDSVTCFSNVLDSNTKCEQHADYVSRKVQDLCTSENRCKIPVTADFLAKNGEENCPGVRKYLKVIYRCSQHPQILQTCPGACKSACWPLCARDCCSPPPPPPPPPVPIPAIMAPPPIPPPAPAFPQNTMPPPALQELTAAQPLVTQPQNLALNAMQSQLAATRSTPQGVCTSHCNPACAPSCLPSCCDALPYQISSPSIALSPSPPLLYPNYHANVAPAISAQQTPVCPSSCLTSCQSGCPQFCCSRRSFPQKGLLRSAVATALNEKALAAMSGGYRSYYNRNIPGNYRSQIMSQRRQFNPKGYYPQANAFPSNAIARSQVYSEYQRRMQ